MKLLHRQFLFSQLLPRLLDKIYEDGYSCTFGEAWRPPEMVAIYAKSGKGSSASVHPVRLAVDINLFKGDTYLTSTKAHEPFGVYWESLNPLCRWGGNFRDGKGNPRPDGNHYSIVYGGRA